MATSAPLTRPGKLTFQDRLGRLTYHQACKLLGDDGVKLLRSVAGTWTIDAERDVYLGGDLFRLRLTDHELAAGYATVVITQMTGRKGELLLRCDQCETACRHAAATLDFLLNDKLLLGLSAPPDESVPLELLTADELQQRALDERRQRASAEKMKVRSSDPSQPWTDYLVTSLVSGRTYRVALRGELPGQSYCSCPDFSTNQLGLCKHTLHVLDKVRRRFKKRDLARAHRVTELELWFDYSARGGLRFNVPEHADETVQSICKRYIDAPLTDAATAMKCIRRLQKAGCDPVIFPDAERWIDQELTCARLQQATADIRQNPAKHPLRKELLKVELLPYQLDGVAFAAGAGRAILADDMGLGKTIQGIGTAELLSRLAGIERVLVICPASLKGQWRDEVTRFCDRSVQLISGAGDDRARQYDGGAFFTVCNYEQVLRDLEFVERAPWDLIILDEGQRIKNWESKTSRVIQSLRSRFALVLTGTPLENRLEELFNVVRFVDPRLMGPAYRFLHRHRMVADTGRVSGYQRLDELREQLRPILLRRTRGQVMKELPERTTSIVRIRPTQEQADLHTAHMKTVVQITRKSYLTEMDLLRLQKALLMCRMAADSTFLVTHERPGYSSKLDRLAELLAGLAEQPDRKIVLFSEWRRMLDEIEPLMRQVGLEFVRLDGQVPQSQRPPLIKKFQTDPGCRVILMTNAGSTGLNLQSANTVINVDLPWNPAVLEQRIARAHRMGQKNPVHVYLLVTEDTLEERLLDTLAAKQELATAALDINSEIDEVQLESGMDELRRRLEKLLGRQPDAPIDTSLQHATEAEIQRLAERRSHVAAAGGQLVDAALQLVGALIGGEGRPAPDGALVQKLHSGLTETVERDEAGRPRLQITLPDDGALGRFAESLARLLVAQ